MRSDRVLFALPLVLAAGCGQAPPPAPPATDDPAGAAYEVVPGWPALPEGVTVGEAAGVAVDSHEHVFVFHRAGADFVNTEIIEAPTVLCLEGETGALVAQWGEGRFVVPHGLSVDAEDNVWLTDVGQHKVFKFSHDGELLLELGRE